MDNKVRIQDDLFAYVNQEKIDQLVIPDDRPVAGGFAELHDNVEKLLMGEFAELEKSGDIQDPNFRKAIDLYSVAKNVKKRNSQGIKPIAKDLKSPKNSIVRTAVPSGVKNARKSVIHAAWFQPRQVS